MDWFYPVLTGAIDNKKTALQRINARWDEFVVQGMGCRCVSDQPWVTVAESCELVMALLAAGDRARAVELYSWLHQWRDDEGVYWTGYQFAEDLLWPDEKPTWTSGAILLAADALTQHNPAAIIGSRRRAPFAPGTDRPRRAPCRPYCATDRPDGR